MADKVFRIISMLRLIPREPKLISTKEILSRLEAESPDFKVDIRTIQRDLVELSGKFALMENGNGWCFMKESEYLQLPDMTLEIALGFKMIDNFLDRMLPKSVLDFLKPYTIKADEILKKTTERENYNQWTEKVALIPYNPMIPSEIDTNVMNIVYEAVLTQKVLDVKVYQKGDYGPESFNTDPLGIVLRDNTLYLVCTSGSRKNVIYRALHRIKSVEMIDSKCYIPEGFNLNDYIKQGEFEWLLSDEMIKFEAEIGESIVYQFLEKQLAPDQKIREVGNGNIIVKATVKDSNNFRFFLMSLADNVRVIKPKKLADEFKNIAQNMAEAYGVNSLNYKFKSF